jgi:DNA-binding MarR family transcriptional regulator
VVSQLTVSDNSPVNESFLNDREIQILMAFKKVSDTVMGKISADIEEATGLSGVEFGVLLRIEELGPAPIRQQGLAESLEWEKSRLSHLLTRMEGRGLVKRKADGPKNTSVSITASGRRAVQTARPVYASSVRRHLLRFMNDDEANAILQIFSQISGA